MEEIQMIVLAIVALLVILCLTIGIFLYACGITRTVEVGAGPPPIGKVTLAYKFGRGPYNECGALFQEALKFAPPNTLTLGIYYDDPYKIPKEKLRFAVGAILSENGIKVEKDVMEKMTAEGFKIFHLPKVPHCVRTEFPFISVLSIFIAIWKVYPKMKEYITEHALCAYPCLEVYTASTIHFMAPLSQQEDFYVPEAKENIPEEYLEVGDKSCLDYTLLCSSRESADRSSRSSSQSTNFSRSYVSSRFGEGDNFSDDDDESNVENDNTHDDDIVQDGEVSSTVDVRASKASTNLLEESGIPHNESYKDDGTLLTDESDVLLTSGQDVSSKQTGSGEQDESANLQDSGICSGRTSASPAENESLVGSEKNPAEKDEDSSSSFEEIKMESVEK